jgi:hypothetical protein
VNLDQTTRGEHVIRAIGCPPSVRRAGRVLQRSGSELRQPAALGALNAIHRSSPKGPAQPALSISSTIRLAASRRSRASVIGRPTTM